MVLGAVVVGILSVAIIVLIPLCATGRIRRNPFIGLRFPSLFASDEAWMTGHRAAVPAMVAGAGLAVVACILVVAVPQLQGTWFALAVVFIAVGAIVGGILGVRAAARVDS